MRPLSSISATLVLVGALAPTGCGSSTGEPLRDPAPQSGAAGRSARQDPGTAQDSGTAPAADPVRAPPTQLVAGTASIAGVTSDGWAVFRDADALRAVKIAANPATQQITDSPGSILIRGRVVFNWANVDWTSNVGDLSVWTADAGAHQIGPTTYAEGLVAASERGGTIVYTANTKTDTTDLMIAPSDLSAPKVLIASMGRGSDTTCGASIAFVGERLFVGSCTVGSRAGKIERFESVGGAWTSTPIAEDALPAWSADASGERVFYQSSGYSGYYAENGAQHVIDTGVSGGFVLPDGSAVLFTVGDQLRRTSLPDVNPLTILTRGYAQPAEFSSRFDVALYSTTVNYDNGTRRDLRITRTDVFNPSPTELVSDPVAGLPRSGLTKDGQFALYLTDMTPSGAALHVRSSDGTERMVLPNVLDAVAAHDGTIVFTDGSTDPNQYPVVADLKMLNLAKTASPTLLEAKIVEGRTFQLDASGKQVVYVRSGIDREPSTERDGLFFQTIP
jgi:hypothetical protein